MSLNFSMSDLEYFNPEEYFTYAGNINSYTDLGLVVGKISKPIMPTVQESIQDVPGMYGGVFMGNDYGEMRFTIPVTLMAFDHTSYNMICDNLRAVFTADANNPGIEYPIVFMDNPDVKYYGHWGQMSDPVFLNPSSWEARATLTFICSQPYGYLPQETQNIEFPNQGVYPSGNATTYPIYTLYLKQDVYNVGFADSHGGYVATGYTVDNMDTNDEGQQINDKMPVIVHDYPNEMSDWVVGKDSQPFDVDGDVSGHMADRDGGGITVAKVSKTDRNTMANGQVSPTTKQVYDFGDPTSGKDDNNIPIPRKNDYGPLATHEQFPSLTSNWKLMVNLWNQKANTSMSAQRAMGRNEIYLLDDQGQRRGRIWIQDWKYNKMPRVGFSLGRDRQHEIDLINPNDKDSGSVGPTNVDGYAEVVNQRPHETLTLTSLYDYRITVAKTKKAKAQVSRYNAKQAAKRAAAKRAKNRAAAKKKKKPRRKRNYKKNFKRKARRR